MFRKPRDTSDDLKSSPLLGRPPTPPGATSSAQTMAVTKTKPSRAVPLPTIGRQGLVGSVKKAAANAKNRQDGKANGSILNFFKKTDHPEFNGLFVEEKYRVGTQTQDSHNDDSGHEQDDGADDVRFNENGGSFKKRRTSITNDEEQLAIEDSPSTRQEKNAASRSGRKAGPFVEDSDSEQEDEVPEAILSLDQNKDQDLTAVAMPPQEAIPVDCEKHTEPDERDAGQREDSRPPLIKEETSFEPGLGDFQDFDDMGDFEEDFYEEGDEYMERRYAEEQAMLEAAEAEKEGSSRVKVEPLDDASAIGDAPSCPICSTSLKGVNESDTAVHVNNCLDGNPTPLPERKQPVTLSTPIKTESSPSAQQFRRPVRDPKPGQASPFTFGESSSSNGSAFNKLMSGHTEEAAWAEAAAAENAARGKPAYQRTCPFYKILPGLFICVDAFRYGAVKGCQAYFLSHFHSDHYVGLTSSWCHGPIYCSKVTANLVLQQLRVSPKYVVPLEWEKPFDIPGTRGVKVTMISANHCPGSSLYLFEKTVGKKTNGEPRLQRILHCGDFRACRMHVEHPLLMPDVQDKVTGKTREQKIDVCYLDTTYLNPKYAFPSQESVIKACADMCVCLNKDTPDDTDGWEQMKRLRAGEGMVKFVQKASASSPSSIDPDSKPPLSPSDPTIDPTSMQLESHPKSSQPILSSLSSRKSRGRLLVVVGTYSIGKERICVGIARALHSKIYCPPSKARIVSALEDPDLSSLLTSDPREAQVHMTALFEIRAETLDDYLRDYFPHFTRAVGFRPTGWSYRPPNSRFVDSPPVASVLHSENWKSAYGLKELVPQRGSTSRASCYGVPYSEHSSFRELTMFCCALRIEKVIPTVNVGNAKSRERMKAWCERWAAERRKNGLYKLAEDGSW